MRRVAYALMAAGALMLGALTSASADCYNDCDGNHGYRSYHRHYGGERYHTVWYEQGPEIYLGSRTYRTGRYDDGYGDGYYGRRYTSYGDDCCRSYRRHYDDYGYRSSYDDDDYGYRRSSYYDDDYGYRGYYTGYGYRRPFYRHYGWYRPYYRSYGYGYGYRDYGYGYGYGSDYGYGYGYGYGYPRYGYGYGWGYPRYGGGWSQVGWGGGGWGGGCQTAYIPYGWSWYRANNCY